MTSSTTNWIFGQEKIQDQPNMRRNTRTRKYFTEHIFVVLLISINLIGIRAFSSSPASGSGGDQIRLATGKRPSLHPLTINALSEALRQRSQQKLVALDTRTNEADRASTPKIDASVIGTTPLDVALTAGKIASDAIAQRRTACEADDSLASDMFDMSECQCIAGRIVGVVTRFRPLEAELVKRVRSAPWVAKYNDYGSFGLMKIECSDVEYEIDSKMESIVMKEILDNPLLRMSRAECLLAIFLDTVERPKLELLKANAIEETMPDKGVINFLDVDRAEVLLDYR